MRIRNEATKLGSLAIAVIASLALALGGCDSGDDPAAGNGNGNGSDTTGDTATGDGGTTDPDGGTTDPDGGTTDPDSGTTDPDSGTTDPDSGTTDPDSVTGDQENCINGKDDDGDGKTDCEDSDCSTNPACVEKCDDGVDNDGDGLVDCDDDDCDAAVTVCGAVGEAETCNDMYLCLIEKGCDCTIGVDCPEDGGNCLQTCFSDADCSNSCLESLTVDTQKAFSNWQDCLGANCQGAADFEACYVGQCLNEYATCFFGCDDDEDDATDEAAKKEALVDCASAECTGLAKEADLSACYSSKCLEETTSCFYTGESDCLEGFFGCYVNCTQGDTECQQDCIGSLSSQGAYDLFSWQDCRVLLCDGDGDNSGDSNECWLGSFFACADKMGSCTDAWPGEGTCSEVTECAIACGGFGSNASECIGACIEKLAEEALGTTSALWTCAINACGTTANAFTSSCIEAALAGDCATEATACGIAVTPTEICDNTTDDDGDGAIDCDDEDCTADPACETPAVEICDNETDDDADEKIDCDDEDCAADPACVPPVAEICDNGIDDDEDGDSDCDDSDCVADAACL